MAYWIDVGGSTSKDPVNAANQAAWLQRTGGHEGRKWGSQLNDSLAVFLSRFEAPRLEPHYE